MTLRRESKALFWGVAIFAGLYHLPLGTPRFDEAVYEALALTRWYAREHVLLCLVPAFFIAGGISVFVSQTSVMKYLGTGARKTVAYGVASVAGTVLAVCSCTVLPLFAGIYGMGAGIGPATAFLYSGPAINALAIILTARVLGPDIGLARAIGAVAFSIVIGLLMHFFFRRDERETMAAAAMPDEETRPLRQTALTFLAMVAILVFANWGGGGTGFFETVHEVKWWLTAAGGVGLALTLIAWYDLPWWKPLVVAGAGLTAGAWLGGPTSWRVGGAVLALILLSISFSAGTRLNWEQPNNPRELHVRVAPDVGLRDGRIVALGRPVLVGTTSIEKSEMLSQMLDQAGIKHNVLNARQHEKEARLGQIGVIDQYPVFVVVGMKRGCKIHQKIGHPVGLHVFSTQANGFRIAVHDLDQSDFLGLA